MTAPTLTEFDHDFWRKPRTEWRERRLHWHCYSWAGPGDTFAKDSQRRDPNTDLPPTVVREWLDKVVRPKQSPTTPDDAVAWLRREFERYAGQMLGTQATDIPEETRWGTALYDLSGGNDISWGFWLAGAASIVSMAVVGVSDCPLHR